MYETKVDITSFEGESVHDESPEEQLENEEINTPNVPKGYKISKRKIFIFDPNSPIFNKGDEQAKGDFLKELFKEGTKKDNQKVDQIIDSMIASTNKTKYMKQLEEYVQDIPSKCIVLLNILGALSRDTSKNWFITKENDFVNVLGHFYAIFFNINIKPTLNKERLVVISITKNKREGASVYYIPEIKLRNEYKKLWETMHWGNEDLDVIANSASFDSVDEIEEVFVNLDVERKLSNDDYNYKIIETISLWID